MECRHKDINIDYKTGEIKLTFTETEWDKTVVMLERPVKFCPDCGRNMIRIKQREIHKEIERMYAEQELESNSENAMALACQLEKYQVLYEKMRKYGKERKERYK